MATAKKTDLEAKTIEGNLGSIDLASVFQILQSNSNEGTLDLGIDGKNLTLFFSQEGVTLVRPARHLGNLVPGRLMNQDRINQAQYDYVMSEVSHTGMNPVDVLLDLEILGGEEILETLMDCIEEIIHELFFLEDATFQFTPTVFNSDLHWDLSRIEPFFLDVDRVALEAAKRADEWGVLQKKIPSVQEIFRVNRNIVEQHDMPSSWTQRLILSLVDGQRTLAEIIDISYLTKFEVCRTVGQLLEGGWVLPWTGAELRKKAEKCLRRNQTDLAAKYLLLALEKCEPDPSLQLLVARAYERAKSFDLSAKYCAEAAELLLQAGRVEEAFRIYSKAAQMVPGDLEIRKRRLDVYLENKSKYPSIQGNGIVSEAISISQRMLRGRDPEQGLELLRRIDRLEGGNLSIKSQIIDVYLNRGMVREAIAEYEKLGSFLVAKGCFKDSQRIFRKILSLDHSRVDVSEKLKRIEKLERRRIGKRRRIHSLMGVLVVVAAAAILYSRYSGWASTELESVLADADSGDVSTIETLQLLKSITNRFPMTRSAIDAETEIQRLRDESLSRGMTSHREAAEQQESAEQSLHLAQKAVDMDDLDLALRHLDRCLDLAPSEQWIESRGIERQKTRILEYMREAEKLYVSGMKALEASNIEESFDIMQKLQTEFPKSRLALTVRLPVKVQSTPPGAEISLNKETTNRKTPCVVLVNPREDNKMVLHHEGFHDVTVELSSPIARDHHVELEKMARWLFPTKGPVAAPPVASDGVLYVGSRDASIYAIDPSGPRLIWRRQLSPLGDVEASLLISGEHLFAGANDGVLYCLNRKTGGIEWSYATAGFVKFTPIISGETLYVSESRGNVHAIDTNTGEQIWVHALDSPVSADPALVDDALIVGTELGTLYRLDRQTGESSVLSRVSSAFTSPVSVGARDFYVGTEDGRVIAFGRVDGALNWSFQTSDAVHGGALVDDGRLWIGGDDGVLRCLREVDGKLISSFQCGGAVRATPMLYEGRIYFGSLDHQFYCLNGKDLSLEWRTKTGGQVSGPASEAYGWIYVGSNDHSLYAFEP